MRLIGIDLGTKTMGIAITDSLKMLATGLENFTYRDNDLNSCVAKVRNLLQRYQNDVETIVLGYPLNVNNTKNERTYLVEHFQKLLQNDITIPIVLQDERYTTIAATARLKFDVGLKSSQIKKHKDKISAVIILEEYINKS
ncbi:MAG: Holliday junction resolvase RuvX [Mycoplasmataceae bacterium]|jgi:putative Holliday junction resolvase|nr:Holliday junction resolvase RuvX [Mycoplasmataceae bacterium]